MVSGLFLMLKHTFTKEAGMQMPASCYKNPNQA